MCLVDTMLGARDTKMNEFGLLSGSDSWAMVQVYSGCKPEEISRSGLVTTLQILHHLHYKVQVSREM